MIKKVISGGQTGADIGALFAAHKTPGVKTGGWAPKGFRTEDGLLPTLGTKYKLKETKFSKYPLRTKLNVQQSDGTLWIGNTDSPGAKLTLGLCDETEYDRPVKRIRYTGGRYRSTRNLIPALVRWVERHNIKVLNVAGNRESTNPGITMFTEAVIWGLLRELSDQK